MQYNVFDKETNEQNLIPEPVKKGHEHFINRKPDPLYPSREDDTTNQVPVDFSNIDTGKSVFNNAVRLISIISFVCYISNLITRDHQKHIPITMCSMRTGLQLLKASPQLLRWIREENSLFFIEGIGIFHNCLFAPTTLHPSIAFTGPGALILLTITTG